MSFRIFLFFLQPKHLSGFCPWWFCAQSRFREVSESVPFCGEPPYCHTSNAIPFVKRHPCHLL